MISTPRLDVAAEVRAMRDTLEARRDPGYEWGMRRTVPSDQPAHATRVPDIRKAASEWWKARRGAPREEMFAVCEGLWATGWREERIVAITLMGRAGLESADWDRLVAWSGDVDNWELVDHLADVTGRMLITNPALLSAAEALTTSENPWQRRLGIVTMIVAFSKGAILRQELTAAAERLQKDPHPLVRRAVVWARDRLRKDHRDGR